MCLPAALAKTMNSGRTQQDQTRWYWSRCADASRKRNSNPNYRGRGQLEPLLTGAWSSSADPYIGSSPLQSP
ncbi:ATP-dependent RNA helicase DDX31 [Biomphalaria pfeifferi]|uniref:ATP-dependent RNA helicase DDX31 n=1 Tax=Biomphalaria pfeifferi TaxID=112525 RepID=A0AAD8BRD2_BIOPF|nr:ATP-dependent RNA helicase DDX31 [Biomphalaria pfeifferi]